MSRKRKTLPKDFEAMLVAGDLGRLQAVFELCDVDARGGYTKQTALAFSACPAALAHWLVEHGASLASEDQNGETPLHARAGSLRGCLEDLLALGANVHHGEKGRRGTPLHRAASAVIPANARLLLEAGAQVDARDRDDRTPLELALERCSNATINRMADLAEVLIAAGASKTSRMRDAVIRIGTNFEFHRAGYNPEAVEVASAALDQLYALLDVPPVPRRRIHVGTDPIVVSGTCWEDRFQELWDLLVPSSGPASTLQGEVVRIAGRIARELDGNGGVNWDIQFRRMADAWLASLGSGTVLPPDAYAEAARIVADVKRRFGETDRMRELSVAWVTLNPHPVALAPPTYDR